MENQKGSGIPLSQKIGYVGAAAAMSIILMYVPTFITIYYTDIVGWHRPRWARSCWRRR